MDVMMQALRVCNPTKIDHQTLYIGLTTGFMLVLTGGDVDIWQYQVFRGNDKDGWHPDGDSMPVCPRSGSDVADAIMGIVAGWRFLYEGVWPDWGDYAEPSTVGMACCACAAQAEFKDLDEAYCGGWYVNDNNDYCPSHAEAGIKEADEQWESRMR